MNSLHNIKLLFTKEILELEYLQATITKYEDSGKKELSTKKTTELDLIVQLTASIAVF